MTISCRWVHTTDGALVMEWAKAQTRKPAGHRTQGRPGR
jgi:hypothetical protein